MGATEKYSITPIGRDGTRWLSRLFLSWTGDLWEYLEYSDGKRYFQVRVNRLTKEREMRHMGPMGDDKWHPESEWWGGIVGDWERADFENIENSTKENKEANERNQ